MVETQLGKIIKVFCRDNAMEYHDSKLLNFLSENGTLFEFSFLGTFQQNERVECNHRHILDFV